MNRRLAVVGVAWCLASGVMAGLVAFSAGGCSPTEMQREDRQWPWRKPEDFDKMPLGPQFDTREKIVRLREPNLRDRMLQWMDLRDAYLKAWRSQGDYGEDVKDIKKKRSVLQAVIQDQVMQIRGSGQPLAN
jgi:hypothetical protein